MTRGWAVLMLGLCCAHTDPRLAEDTSAELSERALGKDVLLIQHDPGFAPANVLVVRMPDGTLVLCSSPYDTAATRTMVRRLRQRFRPGRMVAINVHFHPDGTGGNEGYALEGVETYGSDLTKEALGRRGREARELTAQAASARARPRIAGTPIMAAAKTFRAAEGLRLVFGGEAVQIIHPGPAHSPDNIVVHFPSRGLLYGGDLIRAATAGVGYRGDADLARWPAALQAIAALRFEMVVPGHGASGGRELLEHTRRVVSGTGSVSTRAGKVHAESIVLYDSSRARSIPVELYLGSGARDAATNDTLVVISNGYGIANVAYSFIANPLAERGYIVASVQHDLPGDQPLARTGNLYEGRRHVWQRGAQNILFVASALQTRFARRLGDKVILIGHSNGGDISMWLATERPELVAGAITLDHRRVPIPRVATPRIMTVRADDTVADPGVLPTAEQCQVFRIDVTTVPGARHNDMHDGGGEALKHQIVDAVLRFLAASD